MVIAYHATWSCYGFWLPNDGRGSWSTEVWAPHLRPFGSATKTEERRSLANRPHDLDLRREAKQHLLYPPVRFTGEQARAVARGFSLIIPILQLRILAFAILPDHIHMVIGRHARTIEELVGFLKRAGTRQLNREGIHPLANYRRANGDIPSPWIDDGGWYRYLNSHEEITGAVGYANGNPTKMGLKKQSWSFVEPFGVCGCDGM